MDIERVLIFSSTDGKKQNVNNRANNFVTRFNPELQLNSNTSYYLALAHLSMTASCFNLRPEYNNNILKISKDKGANWVDIRFIPGIYDYDDINSFIKSEIGTISEDNDEYGINIELAFTNY